MAISDSLRSIGKVLRLSRKPDNDEFKQSLRICLLGLVVVGVFGFIIQLIATILIS
jgi:protein transport protein SEC61 subunit gamma-like protein